MLTTATLISLGGAAFGSGMNLLQAQEARDFQKKSDKAAARLMAEAQTKVQKDYFEGLKIPMEAYEQAEVANLQQQQQNIEALQQGDARTLASGVGRVGMLANQNTEQIRAMKAKEMFDLEKSKAENKDDMNQQLIQMDVAAAQDKAARAAQADEQVGTLQAGAATAIIGGVTSATEAQALNPISKEDKLLGNLYKENAELLTKNNISRSAFLTNPEKYRDLITQKPKVNNSTTFAGVSDYSTNFSFPTQNSQLNLNQDKNKDRFSFTPDVNYAFNFQDRMNSFNNRPKLDLMAGVRPFSMNMFD